MARARMIRARRTPTRARAKARTKARIGNQVWAPSQFPLALGFNKVHVHSQGRAYAHRCVSPVSFTVHEGGVPRLPFLCYCIACLSIAARCRYIFGVYYTGTDVAVFVVYYTSIDVAVFCCTSGQSGVNFFILDSRRVLPPAPSNSDFAPLKKKGGSNIRT